MAELSIEQKRMLSAAWALRRETENWDEQDRVETEIVAVALEIAAQGWETHSDDPLYRHIASLPGSLDSEDEMQRVLVLWEHALAGQQQPDRHEADAVKVPAPQHFDGDHPFH